MAPPLVFIDWFDIYLTPVADMDIDGDVDDGEVDALAEGSGNHDAPNFQNPDALAHQYNQAGPSGVRVTLHGEEAAAFLEWKSRREQQRSGIVQLNGHNYLIVPLSQPAAAGPLNPLAPLPATLPAPLLSHPTFARNGQNGHRYRHEPTAPANSPDKHE
jgi:hypothetical protein